MPEIWIWNKLRDHTVFKAKELHVNAEELAGRISNLDRVYDSASDSQANIAKSKLQTLGDAISMEVPELCRRVAYEESVRSDSDIQPLMDKLEDILLQWRAQL